MPRVLLDVVSAMKPKSDAAINVLTHQIVTGNSARLIATVCSFNNELCWDGVCSYLSCPLIVHSEETDHAHSAIIKQVTIGVFAFFVCGVTIMYVSARYSRRVPLLLHSS